MLKGKVYVGDFETTVYKGQAYTEVWASACVELFTENVIIFHSIEEQFDFFVQENCNIIVYYHNLKFDGQFWLSFLLCKLKYKQAIDSNNCWLNEKEMPSKSFKYSISDMGQWYTITIKVGNNIIQIRDSLKLLPFSVARIGKAFDTKHKKLDMEYTGFRYSGCEITDEERKYIANDVLVVKEALEIMFNEGNNKLTIGACCLAEYKRLCDCSLKNPMEYKYMFPNVYEMELDKDIYGYDNKGEWIKRSYRGGWCYLVEEKANKIYHKGTTADVNSLYPSMMHSESGNRYPIGTPTFWSGNYIPQQALNEERYYFIRIKTRFYLKENMLPFVQIKNNPLYKGTESLRTSDVKDPSDNKYYTHYRDCDGVVHDTRVTMTLTMTDYILLQEHYDLVDFEILDGCWFYTAIGIFDEYIDKYKEKKLNSTGAIRELAKLYLNNLYGKMASTTDSSFKLAYEKDDGSLGFISIAENNKTPGYIPVGSAITSYARNFTIRAAQKNYYGTNKRGFIYADTDSIHCDLQPNEITGIKVHDKNFCCWKLEACWDEAIFTRQKTYIEHVTHENLHKIDEPYYNVKCAGMNQKCKDLFIKSMTGNFNINDEEYTEEEKEFLSQKRTLKDFKIGLNIPGKLLPKKIRGGVLLVETTYEMR